MSVTASAELPPTGVWSIAADYSTVGFTVTHHAVSTFRGGFANVTGSFDADAGLLEGQLDVAGGILITLDRLRAQLLGSDCLNADEHPVAAFTSTDIQREGERLTVNGDLTLGGVSRPVVATGTWRGPLTVRRFDGASFERFGLDLTTTIDRREFGISFNTEIAEGFLNLSWDVKLEAALELVR